MMASTDLPLTFTVFLGHAAHQQAEQLSQVSIDWQTAEQAYLNALTRYAANNYLQCLGFVIELNDSYNALMPAFWDGADLLIRGYGRLECRRSIPHAATVHIPEETHIDRLGYLVIELSEDLDAAILLGFLDRVTETEVSLQQLRPLAELPMYLESARLEPSTVRKTSLETIETIATTEMIRLQQWWEGIFTDGWQAIETVLGSQPEAAMGFRSSATGVQRCITVEVGQGQTVILALVLTTQQTAQLELRTKIQVSLQPVAEQHFLPVGLKLSILDEQGEAVMNAQVRDDNQQVQLEFTGETGDRFSVQMLLGNAGVIHHFEI